MYIKDKIEEKPYQPRGLKAFGWGVLGLFGGNVIINISTTIPGAMIGDLGYLFGFIVGMTLAWMFASSRQYIATGIGCYIAFGLQAFAFVVAFVTTINS